MKTELPYLKKYFMESIKAKLQDFKIQYEENVLLKERTWIKTGGIASLWITPSNVNELVNSLDVLCSQNVKFEIVGHTSNIYYLDNYNPEVVLSTKKVKQFWEEDDFIECTCGMPVSILSRYCVDKGFKGYYGLVNLPGTVGAALCNNSSCFGCSLSEHLIDAVFYDIEKKVIVHLAPNDFAFSHRDSKLKRKELNGVLLSIKLDKIKGCIDEEKAAAEEATSTRKITQEAPAYTLGSVYTGLTHKNNFKAKLGIWGGYNNESMQDIQ